MKHLQKFGYITLGAVLALTIVSTAPAIAAQIQTITATANTVNIALDGKQVAAKGESYTLSDGTQVPYSISYKGTTYLPIRKVGELVGQEIYWDQETGTAGVGVNPKAPATTPTPDATTSTDYSTWSAEDEAAYQEFKGMWEVKVTEVNGNKERKIEYVGNLDAEQFDDQYMAKYNFETHESEYDKLFRRLFKESVGDEEEMYIYLIEAHGRGIGQIKLTFKNEILGGLDPSWSSKKD